MHKKIFLCVGFVLFLWVSLSSFVSADVIINEIMYNLDGSDTDREWIEIVNKGTGDVDLTNFVIKDSPESSNHPLSSSMGGFVLSGGGYGVIASDANKFRTDWPSFDGILLTANFTLGNEKETISIKPTKDLPASSEVTYESKQGASGNGKSLQLVGDIWAEGTPTPSSENIGDTTNNNNNTNNNTNTTTTTTTNGTTTYINTIKKVEFVPPPRINAEIIAKGQATVGIPIVLQAKVTGYNKEILNTGRFYWNFGDGTTKDTSNNTVMEGTKKFEHLYKYPGEYIVTFDYYSSYFSIEPDVSSRLVIVAVPAEIQISGIGTAGDHYIELFNPSVYEVDISSWIIQGSVSNFLIPKKTFILPNKKIIISGEDTKFSGNDLISLSLVYPSGKKGFVYGNA